MDWYISKQGVKEGPYSAAEIHALLRDGRLALSQLAWRLGRATWTPIGNISELQFSAASKAYAAEPVHSCRASAATQCGARLDQSISLKTSRAGYSARHWRGELSLPVSFWINGNLLSAALVALVTAMASTDAASEMPRWFAAAGVAYWLLLLMLTVWQLVGIWRSARNYLSQGRSQCWGRLAQATVIFAMVASMINLTMAGVPQTLEFAQLALGRDPIGSYQLRLLRDATELEVSGAVIFGLTSEVAKTLDTYPTVKVIHLNSPGGRVGEARRLRDFIGARKLTTFTTAGCFSACTLAYAAGARRLLGKSASLGFHQYAFPGVQQSAFARQYEKDKSDWLVRGFDRDFIERAFATPHDDLWQPEHRELFAARFVTGYTPSDELIISEGQMERTPMAARSAPH